MSLLARNNAPKSSRQNEGRLPTRSGVCTVVTVHARTKKQGYPESVRQRVMEMYVNGNNLRRIARHLKLAPQAFAYWVTDVAQAFLNKAIRAASKHVEIKWSKNGRGMFRSRFHWILILT